LDPLRAGECSPENPEMIGIAGRKWQVNQKASKLRIYTLKREIGNNIHYFNIYCRDTFDFLSNLYECYLFWHPFPTGLPPGGVGVISDPFLQTTSNFHQHVVSDTLRGSKGGSTTLDNKDEFSAPLVRVSPPC
jgi:hypothetical protein